MVQAIVSPEELRKFAAELKRFNSSLKSDSARLHGQLNRLGETWRDQEHQKFQREFDQTARVIKQFLAASDKYVPFLLRKAEAADQYLRRR